MADFDIFLSHSSKDKCKVELIYHDLVGQNFKVWFDKENIRAGEEWHQAIQDGIDNSIVLVVVWTEDAKNSEWVQKELVRASSKNIPIIPLRLDDAEVNITIQTTQHIDIRSGYASEFPTLVSRINSYVESEPISENQKSRAWYYKKQPFFRSRFLEKNNYLLSTTDTQFAINDKTKLLYARGDASEEEPAKEFMTLTTIPVPNEIFIDTEDITQYWKAELAKIDIKKPEWTFIREGYRRYVHSSRNDLMLYEIRRDIENKISTPTFMRFDENGMIEFADAYYGMAFFQNNIVFRLNTILGLVWKMSYFATNYYSQHPEIQEFQIIINMKGTQNSILSGFASNRGNKQWPSRDNDIFGHYNNSPKGICTDASLQFCYNANVMTISKTPSLLFDLVTHLSKRIQTSFNWYPPSNRHLFPDTENEFDWISFGYNGFA